MFRAKYVMYQMLKDDQDTTFLIKDLIDIVLEYVYETPSTCCQCLTGHTSSIQAIIELKNGNLASCSSDTTIKIWECKDDGQYTCVDCLIGHTDSVRDIIEIKHTVIPSRLISCSWDNTIRVWDKNENGKYQQTECLKDHSNSVNSIIELKKNKDGQFASASSDGFMKIWDNHNSANKYQVIFSSTDNSAALRKIFELKNGCILCGLSDHSVRIWEKSGSSYNQINDFREHSDTVWEFAELSDGKILTSSIREMLIWENHKAHLPQRCIPTGIFSNIIVLKNENVAYCAIPTRAQISIYSLVNDKTVKVYTLPEYHTDEIYYIIELRNGRIVSGSSDTTIRVWD